MGVKLIPNKNDYCRLPDVLKSQKSIQADTETGSVKENFVTNANVDSFSNLGKCNKIVDSNLSLTKTYASLVCDIELRQIE